MKYDCTRKNVNDNMNVEKNVSAECDSTIATRIECKTERNGRATERKTNKILNKPDTENESGVNDFRWMVLIAVEMATKNEKHNRKYNEAKSIKLHEPKTKYFNMKCYY